MCLYRNVQSRMDIILLADVHPRPIPDSRRYGRIETSIPFNMRVFKSTLGVKDGLYYDTTQTDRSAVN